MKKVTYKERNFLDRFRCIDTLVTKPFDTSWKVGGLTYFKHGQFTIFSIETCMIIEMK